MFVFLKSICRILFSPGQTKPVAYWLASLWLVLHSCSTKPCLSCRNCCAPAAPWPRRHQSPDKYLFQNKIKRIHIAHVSILFCWRHPECMDKQNSLKWCYVLLGQWSHGVNFTVIYNGCGSCENWRTFLLIIFSCNDVHSLICYDNPRPVLQQYFININAVRNIGVLYRIWPSHHGGWGVSLMCQNTTTRAYGA